MASNSCTELCQEPVTADTVLEFQEMWGMTKPEKITLGGFIQMFGARFLSVGKAVDQKFLPR